MVKQLPINIYTQINTDEANYLIQNRDTSHAMKIIVADTQPVPGSEFDFRIKPYCGISSNQATGIIWGMPDGKAAITVGIVEG